LDKHRAAFGDGKQVERMMAAPTRSERKTVRPFLDIDAAEDSLDDVRLIVGDEEHKEGPVVLESHVLGTQKIALRLPEIGALRAAVKRMSLKERDCGLVVIAASHTHRYAQVLLRDSIDEASYHVDFALKRLTADLVLNDQNGFILTVAIVLLRDLKQVPLRPYIAGTWLARRVFNISPEKEDTSFSPEELTDAIRDQFGLPKSTLRYIHVDDDVITTNAIGDSVHVYVDGEVLNLLLANPTEPVAVQMQIELAIQATELVAQSVVRFLRDELGHEPSESDLLGYEAPRRFFENLARTLESHTSEVMRMTETPELLRAFLEAAFNMRDATSAALKEK
jgi:hypothetical protein